ncbi:CD180 antigen [Tiliqua scincoides]|uniref:CD180 antigen n=1 Tax=Tiliqua scincoides TaxID=71010 RepID=UPI0034637980
MACRMYCWVLMGLLGVSCKVTKPADKMCTELVANRSYSCEGLGLKEVPEQLPSITEVLDFSFNFLYSLQHSTFTKLKDLVYLDLTRCQINWVYGGSFGSNSHLETIVLTGNKILFLADAAFTGPYSLKHLDLTQTGLTSLTFIPMQDLDNLETLILGGNHIQSLQLPSNFPTRNLKYLDFQMNIIQKISTEDIMVLKQVSNLTLILKGNNIAYVETRAFSSIFFYSLDFGGCVNISVILEGLQDARATALWLGTFEDSLGDDSISDTMLQNICSISVDYLNLQHRHFLGLSTNTFRCLAKLQKLDLTHTSLTELPANLVGMNLLKELNLNKNNFEHLCNICSSAFAYLTHLYISGNSKSLDLGSGCLEPLSKLEHLDLSNSHIKSLDCCSKQFHGLSSLQHLNLSYNDKLSFHDVAFNECANLRVLDLTSTHTFTDAPQGPFRNLHLLQMLNLSYSQVGPHIQQILQGLGSLVFLALNGNDFEHGILNDHLFQQTPNLEVLTLSSCKLSAIQSKTFYALKKLTHVDLSHNQLTAFNSEAFFSLKNIYLNFASNKIHIIPRDTLTTLSGQSVINLSYNPLECTCSNVGLLTWYRQNVDKIEDSEVTLCSEPKSLMGTQLFFVNLSCGYSTAQVILIIFVVTIILVVTFILLIYFFKRKYQRI